MTVDFFLRLDTMSQARLKEPQKYSDRRHFKATLYGSPNFFQRITFVSGAVVDDVFKTANSPGAYVMGLHHLENGALDNFVKTVSCHLSVNPYYSDIQSFAEKFSKNYKPSPFGGVISFADVFYSLRGKFTAFNITPKDKLYSSSHGFIRRSINHWQVHPLDLLEIV